VVRVSEVHPLETEPKDEPGLKIDFRSYIR
jgi:hypothetical protein